MTPTKLSAKPLSNTELSNFCAQLAMVIKAGISVAEGILILEEDAASAGEKEILTALKDSLAEQGQVHIALADAGVFPDYMVHMVQLGEESGTLDEVMEALNRHYAREAAIRKSIRSAVTYPAAMIGMMIAVVIVLLVKVLPLFNQVFMQLGTEMTGVSAVLMQLGQTISRYSVVLILLVAAAVAFLLYGFLTETGKHLMQRLGYKLPFTRNLFEKTAACRFAGAMALALRSGLSPDRSLELAEQTCADPFFGKKLTACRSMVDEGEELSRSLAQSGVFSGMYGRLSSVGSKTGSLDGAMEQIAELYTQEIDSKLNNLLGILEPALVMVLSVIVGVILLSVMLPLMGILSGI